ncbi:deacetylase [Sphingosinicella sp. BN140058]|nr:deacetylase [Sphingosinicella sp. BN140058]
MNAQVPAFQITIDTEGDNAWLRPSTGETRNAEYLSRFQYLCECYGFRPTYLVNWEMANSPAFQELGRDILQRGVGEIGMHLHAWDSPPLRPLTADDAVQHPYLIEFPEQVMRDKVACLTDRLEAVFGTKMLSHRAGRWAFNETYARILMDHGYQADCSVTPHRSWKSVPGAATGSGGSDYTDFPDRPFWWHEDGSRLLEIPVSILRYAPTTIVRGVRRLLGRPGHRLLWLRPNGRNLGDMLFILESALQEKRDYVQFVLHSSELMPGGSPTFTTAEQIETLYRDLETLFDVAARNFAGGTLAEYARTWRSSDIPGRSFRPGRAGQAGFA